MIEQNDILFACSRARSALICDIDESDGDAVTHVIARSSGTDKAKRAEGERTAFTSALRAWLVACASANTRVSEELYPLGRVEYVENFDTN